MSNVPKEFKSTFEVKIDSSDPKMNDTCPKKSCPKKSCPKKSCPKKSSVKCVRIMRPDEALKAYNQKYFDRSLSVDANPLTMEQFEQLRKEAGVTAFISDRDLIKINKHFLHQQIILKSEKAIRNKIYLNSSLYKYGVGNLRFAIPQITITRLRGKCLGETCYINRALSKNKIRNILRALHYQEWYKVASVEEGIKILLTMEPVENRAKPGEIGKTAIGSVLQLLKVIPFVWGSTNRINFDLICEIVKMHTPFEQLKNHWSSESMHPESEEN
jgi:hypothetical protein